MLKTLVNPTQNRQPFPEIFCVFNSIKIVQTKNYQRGERTKLLIIIYKRKIEE